MSERDEDYEVPFGPSVGEMREASRLEAERRADRRANPAHWLGRIEAALGITGPSDPEYTLREVERLVRVEARMRRYWEI